MSRAQVPSLDPSGGPGAARSASARSRTARAGRPRDDSLDVRVLAAAVELLAAGGVRGLKADEVAARSGIPKSTIYRRWPSLNDLAVDAVDAALGDRTVVPTSDPLADLTVAVHRAHALFTSSPLGAAVPQLALDLLGRPDAAAAYRDRVIAPLRDAAIHAVQRAQSVGLWEGPDPETAIDMMMGTLLYRLTYLGHVPDLSEAFDIADFVAGRPLPRPATAREAGGV